MNARKPTPARNKKLQNPKRFINPHFENELPFSNRAILYTIIAFCIAFLIWANNATLDEVARGMGQVVPSSEIQIVESLDPGIVEAILVNEGDIVEPNEEVLRLRDIQATADLESSEKEFYSLKARAQRLRAQAGGLEEPDFTEIVRQQVPASVREERQSFVASLSNIDSQIDILERQKRQKQQEIQETRARINDLRQVLEVTRDEYNILQPLVERGSAAKVELLQIERKLREQETELNSLQASIPRMREAARELESKQEEIRSKAKAEAQEELAQVVQKINSLEQTIKGLQDKKVRTTLRSPVKGTVKEINVNSVGEVVKPGEQLIQIVPDNDQLIIETRIRPEQIAFIRPGQKAVVQITAYDFAVYGGLNGKVVDISADTITNEEGEAYYRVRVLTEESRIERKNETLPIIPGMIASVDIVTGHKTVMEYILNPIIRTLDRSLSEK